MRKMTNGKVGAKKLANRILRQNQNRRSYRTIARDDYPGVKPGTLNRIANSRGDWLPKDEGLLIVLGLKKPPRSREWRQSQSIIEAMANITRQALRWKLRGRNNNGS